jgi:hypothetical protein
MLTLHSESFSVVFSGAFTPAFSVACPFFLSPEVLLFLAELGFFLASGALL